MLLFSNSCNSPTLLCILHAVMCVPMYYIYYIYINIHLPFSLPFLPFCAKKLLLLLLLLPILPFTVNANCKPLLFVGDCISCCCCCGVCCCFCSPLLAKSSAQWRCNANGGGCCCCCCVLVAMAMPFCCGWPTVSLNCFIFNLFLFYLYLSYEMVIVIFCF